MKGFLLEKMMHPQQEKVFTVFVWNLNGLLSSPQGPTKDLYPTPEKLSQLAFP
jgi:hypothetical protein